MKKNNSFKLLILAIIIGAFLRFGGISWGLPIPLHPDEGFVTRDAYKLAASNSFETKTYNRPNHVSIKANSLIYLAINKFVFNMSDGTSISENFNPHFKLFYSASRSLSALLGVISIVLVYLIGKEFDKNIGLIAAWLTAIFPSFVEHAHYITPEILQTFFMLLVTYFAILYTKHKRMLFITFMSIFAAFAFCEKYPAGYSCIIIAFSIITTHHKDVYMLLKRSLIAFSIFITSIFLISPVLIIDYSNVLIAIKNENHVVHLGGDNLGIVGNFLYYFQTYLSHSGLILFILAFAGIFYCIKKYKNFGYLIILGCLYIVPLSFTNLHWERWGVPMYVNMLLLSSIGFYQVSDYIFNKIKINKFKYVSIKTLKIVWIIIVGILPLVNMSCVSLAKTASFIATDTRIAAIEYCKNNGISNENSYFEGYTPFNPTGPGTTFEKFENYDINKPKDANISYVILSSYMYNRYYDEPERYKTQIEFYENLKSNYKEVKKFQSVSTDTNLIAPIKAIKDIIKYSNGGNSGPNIIIYKLND